MARQLPASATGILSYFTRHATAANLILLVLLAAGVLVVPKMRAQFFPDVVIDSVTVSVRWDGAGAEDIDEGIVQLLEPALLSVEGVTNSSARASEGVARISLEFEPNRDMSRAASDVEEAVSSISNLPAGAEDPEVIRDAWRDPVTDVVISGPVGLDQIARFSDEMVAMLFNRGVTRTMVQGLADGQIIVEVPTVALIRHDVTMQEIAGAIGEEAVADPAGTVASGTTRVRTGVAKRSPDEIAAIVLRSNADGSKLTVGDVATIRTEGIDRLQAYYVDGRPAILIKVTRTAQGDSIKMQQIVEDIAADMLKTLPEGMSIELVKTRVEMIKGRLAILMENGAMGLALVVLLLFLFLNTRTAFWVAAGIPVSMMAAVALMYWLGLSFNMISLFALIITLGIVADDAIVVGEHADFRVRHYGEAPVIASETAARRMFPPVFSATLTTVIAFCGLIIIGGRFGDIVMDIPVTVIAVLAVSLLECFIVLPNHMAHALRHADENHWYDWPSRQVNKGFRFVRERLFRPLMKLVVVARYPVLAGTVLVLAAQTAMFLDGRVQFRFFNAPEQSTVTANFSMVNGATRADTHAMMRATRDAVMAYGEELEAEYGTNPVLHVLGQVGGTSGRGLASAQDKEADLLGSVSIELIDADLRPYSSFTFVSELQARAPNHPKLEELALRGARFGPGGDALDIEFTGASTKALKAAAEDFKTELARFPEVSAVEDSLAYDKDELILDLTVQGEALGFSIDTIGTELRRRLAGIEAASYPDGGRTGTIRVELPDSELNSDFLEQMMMRTSAGEYVPLADIVTATTKSGFATINRENGLRVVSVTGDIDESDPQRAAEILETVERQILPEISERHGVSFRLAGLSEQEEAFLADARTALILTLIGIFLTLAWIFASWTRPLVVMGIIPFGLIGAILGHYTWDVPMSMFSIVGLIGMVGIIINDSIVLVTTIDEYRQDRDTFQAIVDGAVDRLRPVFLTTATTVIGLAPLLFETSSQAQFLKPTVITLTYGLGFGFVLVLLVVPALVAVQEDLGRYTRALRRLLRPRHGKAEAASALVWTLLVLIVAGFMATIGWVLTTGTLPAGLFAGAKGQIAIAAGLFMVGVTALLLLVGVATALVSKRPTPPDQSAQP